MSRKPRIALTMGDAAGVGPEIIVKALGDPGIRSLAEIVVIGDAQRLHQAAAIVGANFSSPVMTELDEDVLADAGVAVLQVGSISEQVPFGEISAEAGDAAYRYLRQAVDLAMSQSVDAICTAPINKRALQLGGHNYPGHTELLADLTQTPEVSMMLQAPNLRVIHVTTHVGLREAIDLLEPNLIARTIARGDKTLRDGGVTAPRIAVCAVNPHAGESGLFGDGEEESRIAPGIATAQEAGIDAVGPVPADTAFYRAVNGEFDLVVAMYHDQGHCPIKVLGIDSGVNITVGLPVVRTSVDHGTAFDIAGTGAADERGMLEALRQAVSLAAVRG